MRRNYVRRVLCLPSRVAHSLVWILPDCHGIVALLVMSGKQPWFELLHTLRFICVCCVGHLSASVQHFFTSLPHQAVLLLLVFDRSRCQSSRLASRGTASPTCQGVTKDNPKHAIHHQSSPPLPCAVLCMYVNVCAVCRVSRKIRIWIFCNMVKRSRCPILDLMA